MTLSLRQLIAVLAVVVKRDWIDQPDQRQGFFQVLNLPDQRLIPLSRKFTSTDYLDHCAFAATGAKPSTLLL